MWWLFIIKDYPKSAIYALHLVHRIDNKILESDMQWYNLNNVLRQIPTLCCDVTYISLCYNQIWSKYKSKKVKENKQDKNNQISKLIWLGRNWWSDLGSQKSNFREQIK